MRASLRAQSYLCLLSPNTTLTLCAYAFSASTTMTHQLLGNGQFFLTASHKKENNALKVRNALENTSSRLYVFSFPLWYFFKISTCGRMIYALQCCRKAFFPAKILIKRQKQHLDGFSCQKWKVVNFSDRAPRLLPQI